MSEHDDHTHDHKHDHGHDHDNGHAPHPFQPDIEDGPITEYMVLTRAIGELMVEKGVFAAEDLREKLEYMQSRKPALGARLIARAWTDPAFAARLERDAMAAAQELDIDVGVVEIRALPDRPGLHNVIVCTLCSCYPVMLLGNSPDWYKSREYRSRVVREPRAVLAEFGTEIPAETELRIHDSTAELRYFVIPERPAGTEGWSEERLADIVTRDCMIGTALPKPGAA
ncbi:MAG: nitrile hydratase subunit alpha [Proteobacteria bacterium]|nr:nitrile hydratase subunit alpha [Pseudomonadota bacterium]